jgi:hypothetical protein
VILPPGDERPLSAGEDSGELLDEALYEELAAHLFGLRASLAEMAEDVQAMRYLMRDEEPALAASR